MQTATCVVCQERVNLHQQKLVTTQWVDARSGTLLSLTFHSDCYVRWYHQTAQGTAKQGQAPRTPRASLPAPSPAAQPAPGQGEPALPQGETGGHPAAVHLSPDELQRLERLRGRRDTDAALDADKRGGAETEQRDGEDDQPPDDEHPKDGHDVPPPHV
jgi:hypothetical protein